MIITVYTEIDKKYKRIRENKPENSVMYNLSPPFKKCGLKISY